VSLHLPEPGEYGVDILVSVKGKKRSYTHACQYLVLYLHDDEKTNFVSEVTQGHVLEEVAGSLYDGEEREVNWLFLYVFFAVIKNTLMILVQKMKMKNYELILSMKPVFFLVVTYTL